MPGPRSSATARSSTATPAARRRSASSASSPAGPSVRRVTSSLHARSSSARCTPVGPRSSTPRGFSRTSQPWQNGQWNTAPPQRSAIPGLSGWRYSMPPASRTRRADSRRPSPSSSTKPRLPARAPGRPRSLPRFAPRRTGRPRARRARGVEGSAGGRPSWPSSPPMPCAGRLLCPPASTTRVRRRARPSTRAALNPAAPPPTTMQSHISSMGAWCWIAALLPT